jgi:hypothetical protein
MVNAGALDAENIKDTLIANVHWLIALSYLEAAWIAHQKGLDPSRGKQGLFSIARLAQEYQGLYDGPQ